VTSLIAGPFVYICGGCVNTAIQSIEADTQHEPKGRDDSDPGCGDERLRVLGKEAVQTEHLVTARRGGRICDECLDLCS
jgi:hypothetical protein